MNASPRTFSIVPGYDVHRNKTRFQVSITKDRVRHYLGSFATVEEAAEVAQRERARLFGDFAGRG